MERLISKTKNPDYHSGPNLKFDTTIASWTGDEVMEFGTIFREKRLTFEAKVGRIVKQHLVVKNVGTTSIFYDWTRLPLRNTFDGLITKPKFSRFYFNIYGGRLVPGQEKTFLFCFFSRDSGIFREEWEFRTKPVLCGGASLRVVLKGVAIPIKTYNHAIRQIQQSLERKENTRVVASILDQIISYCVRHEKKSSVEKKIELSTQEQFELINPSYTFNPHAVEELSNLFASAIGGTKISDSQWNFSLESLEKAILEVEDPEELEHLINAKDALIQRLHEPSLIPLYVSSHQVVYILFVQMIDKMVEESIWLQDILKTSWGKSDDQMKLFEDDDSRKSSRKSTAIKHRDSGPISKLESSKTTRVPKNKEMESLIDSLSKKKSEINTKQIKSYMQRLYIVTYSLLANTIDAMDRMLLIISSNPCTENASQNVRNTCSNSTGSDQDPKQCFN